MPRYEASGACAMRDGARCAKSDIMLICLLTARRDAMRGERERGGGRGAEVRKEMRQRQYAVRHHAADDVAIIFMLMLSRVFFMPPIIAYDANDYFAAIAYDAARRYARHLFCLMRDGAARVRF